MNGVDVGFFFMSQ